ncbi:MAG TPA: hypothetical protein PKD26_03315 [Pyrinomonadaceae bacterium]|nr:hypothetical protein [Pyrinomonadaceae bacterium]
MVKRSGIFLFAFAFGICGVVSATAQDPAEVPKKEEVPAEKKASPCPKVTLKLGAPSQVREGTPVAFVADINGGDPDVLPNLIWSVSAGMIKEGQGERRIAVDSNGAGANRQITAELWIGGYAPECVSSYSAMIRVVPPAMLLDEFSELPTEKENERIATAAGYISQATDRFYIIAYAGRSSERGYAIKALRRQVEEFAKHEIAASRIRVIDGGFREEPAYEYWFVPDGAEPPRARPTVDPREVTPPRTTPTRAAPTRRP